MSLVKDLAKDRNKDQVFIEKVLRFSILLYFVTKVIIKSLLFCRVKKKTKRRSTMSEWLASQTSKVPDNSILSVRLLAKVWRFTTTY